MDYLNWELSLLSRSIGYANLSRAAAHVGVSQPQLSRIVSKLETELGVTLLNREAKRKAAWTPEAYRLAEIYLRAYRQFRGEIQDLAEGSQITQIEIGTLEGLIPLAIRFAQRLFKRSPLKIVEITVEDRSALEERFTRGGMDFLFTCWTPGRRKFKHTRKLGYQTLHPVHTDPELQVMSAYEFNSKVHHSSKNAGAGKLLISNSLEVRKTWLNEIGGTGLLPSDVRESGELPILLLASDGIPPSLWQQVSGF